tara:strand:- start:372 stop:1358 length:987 start_codon:yes stop_codon:yes gene_type:complete
MLKISSPKIIPEAQISGSLTEGLEIRRRYFPDTIRFHNPGLRRHQTSEISCQQTQEFVSISLTGTRCALDCKHCGTSVLRGMKDLSRSSKNLFELCSELSRSGTRGILISGGCDRYGRVPILPHIPDLIRARRELGITIRVHPGLPDEETAKGLAELDIDGAMVDIIGNNNTIRDVYHLNAKTEDYDAVMARLNRHDVPLVPHIILGLHFGKMLGEWKALEMTAKHRIKLLVLVILMPLNGTQMQNVSPPSLQEIGAFFNTARKALPQTEIMLGCARPLGKIKIDVDRLAIESGLNGIAFPAEGTLSYARQHGLEPEIINACCGVNWN